MTKEELKIKIGELLPAAVFEEGGDPVAAGWLNIHIVSQDWLSLAQQLRTVDSSPLRLSFLPHLY